MASDSVLKHPVRAVRKALERLNREASDAGLRFAKKATPGDPTSHRVVLEAAPNRLAFYSNVGPGFTPLGGDKGYPKGSSRVVFEDTYKGARVSRFRWGRGKIAKDAEDYFKLFGKVPERHKSKLRLESQRDAEVVVYSLDSNWDGRISAADKESPCAKATERHKVDYCLIRGEYGRRLVDGKSEPFSKVEAVAVGLRGWTEPADSLANQRPGPLFVYTISELFSGVDYNGDGDTEDELIIGDVDSSGKLSMTERKALIDLGLKENADVIDNIEIDSRFKASEGKASALQQVQKIYKQLNEEQAREVIRNSLVRAQMNLIVEHDDPKKQVRYRRRLFGSIGFRNALMVLREMTK